MRALVDRTVSPSYVPCVARATRELIDRIAPYGTYHCVATGLATWVRDGPDHRGGSWRSGAYRAGADQRVEHEGAPATVLRAVRREASRCWNRDAETGGQLWGTISGKGHKRRRPSEPVKIVLHHEGNHSGRGQRDEAVSADANDQQAVIACLRQTDNLLSPGDADVGRHPRRPHYQYASGPADDSGPARGRGRVGDGSHLPRAAETGRNRTGLCHRRRLHWFLCGLPDSGRQHLLRQRSHSATRRLARSYGGGEAVRLSRPRPRAIWSRGVRRGRSSAQPRGEAEITAIELGCDWALLL